MASSALPPPRNDGVGVICGLGNFIDNVPMTNDGIDVHAHGVPQQFLEEVKRTRLGGVDVTDADGGYVVTFPGRKPLRPAAGIMLDFTHRLGWLDTQGMQQQLIGPWL